MKAGRELDGDLAWLCANLEGLRARWAGYWIAIVDEGIWVHGADLYALVDALERYPVDTPLITLIPKEESSPHMVYEVQEPVVIQLAALRAKGIEPT